jgi:hypothetical protein
MLKDERGGILVLTALSLTLLLSFLAIAIDVGNLYFTQRQVQTLADSAAMAAALEVSACGGTTNCSVIQTAATSALTEDGSSAPTLFQQCASASGTGLLLTINNPPCALGASDPNNGNANYVEVVVTETKPSFFAGFFGIRTAKISARAEAGLGSIPPSCFNVTGTSGQTLTLDLGASITDGPGSNCGVYVNSTGAPAVMENSGATVNVSGNYDVQGSVTDNGGSYTPLPTKGPVVPDPFKNLTAPAIPSAPSGNSGTSYHSGYYSGGITFSGANTLAPGLYYMGGNIILNTGASITGTGVTIYLAPGAGINSNGLTSTITLTAPASALSNCAACAGMLIWGASTDTSPVNLDTGSNSSFGGAIYLPDAQLTLNGGSNVTAYGMVVAQSAMVDSAISLNCSSMPGGVCPGSGGGSGGGSTTISLAE